MNAVMFNKQYIFFSADNLDTSNKSKMFYYKYKKTDMETANYSYTLHVPNVIKQQSELTKLSSTYERHPKQLISYISPRKIQQV